MSADDLAEMLRDMAVRVETGDSLGGSIEYEATRKPGEFTVRGAYRIDNTFGQGGMRLIEEPR